jgi:ribosomal-protein-alanine N-acetyltransferase
MIRVANKYDLKALLKIENESFDENSFVLSSKNFIYHIGKNPLFVYEYRGEICGYILIFLRKNSKKIRIYSLAVDKKFRGLGIASKLLDKSLSYAKKMGKSFAKLEVRIDNKNAIKLYEKLGFIYIKKLKSYYPNKIDAFVMQKILQ